MAAILGKCARFPASFGRTGVHIFGRSLLAVPLLSGAVLSSTPAAAQEELSRSVAPSDQSCLVYTAEGSREGVEQLRASCGGRGIILGETSGYEVTAHEALQATIVDTRLDGERRILLISHGDDGQPLVEDLSGQIALAAGRGPLSDLNGLEIDFSRYVSNGDIAVRPAAENAARDKSGAVSIGEQIALEKARQTEAAVQN